MTLKEDMSALLPGLRDALEKAEIELSNATERRKRAKKALRWSKRDLAFATGERNSIKRQHDRLAGTIAAIEHGNKETS